MNLENYKSNQKRETIMTLTKNQTNCLKVVYKLSEGLLTTPVGFGEIFNELKPAREKEIASDLQYLGERNYLRHDGLHYYLTGFGLDFVESH